MNRRMRLPLTPPLKENREKIKEVIGRILDENDTQLLLEIS